MAWIESHQELREHPKTKRLCRVLALPRPTVIGYLHFLWWWAYDYAPEGDLSAFTDEDIADAVDWEGDPGAFVAALIQTGFIDESRHIHDWEDFAQKWIERRQADRERKRAERRKTETVPQTSDGHPAEIHSLSGVTGPNRTGPNRTGPDTTTPKPPPQADGGLAPTRRRRRRDEPVAEILAPATADDHELWVSTTSLARQFMAPTLFERLVQPLVPIGRAPDGGLRLRAPPAVAGEAQRNVSHVVSKYLEEVGDAAGSRAAIVG